MEPSDAAALETINAVRFKALELQKRFERLSEELLNVADPEEMKEKFRLITDLRNEVDLLNWDADELIAEMRKK